ncbi:MAG: hypothetical protein ABIC68_00370 [Candidatus Omnitrophota bacterium]
MKKRVSTFCSFLRSLFFRPGMGFCAKRFSGQAIVEYFILLVLLTGIAIIGSSVFFSNVHGSVKNFEGNCFEAMGQQPIEMAEWEEETPWWEVDLIGGEGEGAGPSDGYDLGVEEPKNW